MSQQSVASETVSLTVNGEERDLPAGSSVAGLLQSHQLDPRLVVVELNRSILREREQFPFIELREGDVVEIVHFVGGG